MTAALNMTTIRISHDAIMRIKTALDAGGALAEQRYQDEMRSGSFDKALFDATNAAAEARILFKIGVTDNLPAIELEVAP